MLRVWLRDGILTSMLSHPRSAPGLCCGEHPRRCSLMDSWVSPYLQPLGRASAVRGIPDTDRNSTWSCRQGLGLPASVSSTARGESQTGC